MSVVFHSLRWRLQLWHGAILLLAVLAFCLTAYRLAWASQLRHIDKSIAQLKVAEDKSSDARADSTAAVRAPPSNTDIARAGPKDQKKLGALSKLEIAEFR